MNEIIDSGKTFVDELNLFLERNFANNKIALLVDENTEIHCLPKIISVFEKRDYKLLRVDSGEQNKSIQTCARLWQELLDFGFNRNSLLVVLGGGTLCDIGGFIASTYQRGIKFIYLPTTLLSQTDAAWGGKNGVNFNDLKNQIGTINLPELVAVNIDFLETLPQKEFTSGLAEVIKHGIISDKSILEDIERNRTFSANILPLIRKSASVKMSIVNRDVNDTGERKALNFGHTIGHAIEAVHEGKYTHGECVAAGMLVTLYLSKKLLHLNADEYEYCSGIIHKNISLPKINPEKFPAIISKTFHDKKNTNGQINFVLLKSLGSIAIDIPVTEEQILEAMLKKL